MGFDLRQYATSVRLTDGSMGVRLTDGATGTELARLGLSPGTPAEVWNAVNPSAVEQVARSYVQAGSEVILTNTLCANRFMLGLHGVESRTAELAEAGRSSPAAPPTPPRTNWAGRSRSSPRSGPPARS